MIKDKMGNKLTRSEIVYKLKNRILNILLDFEIMLLRWVGHIPSHFIRLVFYRLRGVKIGKGSRIHMWCNFFNPANIEIGDDTIIGNNAFLDGRANLKIGNHVAIASRAMIYNSEHDIESEEFKALDAPVAIGDYVFIGPGVIILPGVRIGKGAVVGAGSVVTKDVESFTLVGGVPAKFIKNREKQNLKYILGRARLFQ